MNLIQDEKIEFEKVYDELSNLLYRLSLSHVKNSQDAEDIVHDVFAKYIEVRKTFKDDEHRRAWFVRVTVNKCHDFLRKKSHRDHLSLDDISEISQNENLNLPRVFNLVSSLSEKYKTVMVLHYLEGYGVKEISSMLYISVSAVKMRLSRGRDMLKDKMEKEEENV